MIIIGAGMAGLIAGHYFARLNPTLYEAQPSLPNNHDALLRFRSDKVARLTGIDFQAVHVRKAVLSGGQYHTECNPWIANMYSRKVTDEVTGRSIWNLAPVDRWVAPMDFVARAASGLRISFDSGISDFDFLRAQSVPVISTIPMPVLMEMAGWERPEFKWRPIWSITVTITEPVLDVYQTLYYPDFSLPYYRASITGSKLIIECLDEPDNVLAYIRSVCKDFGIWPQNQKNDVSVKRQEYGKIVAVDSGICKDFMYTMTREHGIYSLGRFATWRQLLMDDVVDDCVVIERLIKAEASRSGYHDSLKAVSPITRL